MFTSGGEKRKATQDTGPATKKVLSESDLIVLGLPYSTTYQEMSTYFKEFGELVVCEVIYSLRIYQLNDRLEAK